MREDILARGEDPADFPILNSRPEMFQDLLWIWDAFMILSSARQIGMSGPQPISMADIVSYCEFEGIDDPEERQEFRHHVQKLDSVYLADVRARQKAQTDQTKTPQRRGLGQS